MGRFSLWAFPKIFPEEILQSTTANHLSCHALASPWRANVSSCEERTPPTLRATSSLRARAWRFVLLTGSYGERAASRPDYCLQHIPAHSPPSKTASFVQEAGGPRQWMGEEVCGTWYIPFLKIVMNGIRFGSAHLLVALCSRLECFLCAFQQMVHLLPRRAFCSFALLD